MRDLSDELLIHKDELEAVQNVQKGSSVHFLPYEDPYSKGFKLRERLIPPRLEKLVYPMGNALPTVIVDGMIVGTWNVSVDHDELRLNVGKLVPLEKRAESRIVEEGLSLGKFLAKDVKVRVSIGSETTSKWQTISLSSSRAARSRRLE